MKKFFALITLCALFFSEASFGATSVIKVTGAGATPIRNGSTNTSSVSAGSAGVSSKDASISSEKMMMPPISNNDKSYVFDEQATKNMLAQTSSLLRVNCNNLPVLQSMGFGSSASSKIVSLGVQEGEYDYTVDFRSCSLWGNKRNAVWSNKTLTEEQALATANSFMKTSGLKKKVFTQYGKPIIIYRNINGGGVYPMMKEISSTTTQGGDFNGIEIDDTDTGTNVGLEYISFSIMFPFSLNGKTIYNQYGNPAGITLEINADGVSSVNAQLLPFKGALRTSDKMGSGDIISFIKRGGNSAFWGQSQSISLNKPEKVLVLFSLRRNNATELYLSSGIRFSSDVRVDQWSQRNYEMIISDYKIGNQNYGY